MIGAVALWCTVVVFFLSLVFLHHDLWDFWYGDNGGLLSTGGIQVLWTFQTCTCIYFTYWFRVMKAIAPLDEDLNYKGIVIPITLAYFAVLFAVGGFLMATNAATMSSGVILPYQLSFILGIACLTHLIMLSDKNLIRYQAKKAGKMALLIKVTGLASWVFCSFILMGIVYPSLQVAFGDNNIPIFFADFIVLGGMTTYLIPVVLRFAGWVLFGSMIDEKQTLLGTKLSAYRAHPSDADYDEA